MKLEKAYFLTQIFAGIAVVGSLIFVGVSIQQNSSQIRAATIQSITENSINGLRELSTNSEYAELRLKGQSDPTSLTETEKFQYFTYNRQYWLSFQNVFYQYQLGVLEEEIWNGYLRIICIDIQKPGFRETWQDHANVLSPDFVAVVESCSGF